MTQSSRFSVDPTKLEPIRNAAHMACQWPSRAARANLEAAADDSHSSLSWDEAYQGLVSQGLNDDGARVGFSFTRAALFWTNGNGGYGELPLGSQTENTIGAWLDEQLDKMGLKPTSKAEMPYDLGLDEVYHLVDQQPLELAALGDWFAHAHQSFSALLPKWQEHAVSPLTVHCWPHHFDIAILVILEEGDAEYARSIGMGMSPGDGSYPEPYFYCTPWPPPNPETLPEGPEPFQWHTEEFVALVLPASRLTDHTNTRILLRSAYELLLTRVLRLG